jgi:hypothetical protein
MASAAESCANNGQSEIRRGFLNMGLKPSHNHLILRLPRNDAKVCNVLKTHKSFVCYSTFHNQYFPESYVNHLTKIHYNCVH